MVASIFHRGSLVAEVDCTNGAASARWTRLIRKCAWQLFALFVVFSTLLLSINDSRDYVAVGLALGILAPALSVTPWLTLATGKPFGAALFTLVLVFFMKLLGCVVVVLRYGWHASEHGEPRYTDMPWTHPNLLVWMFWINTGLLCAAMYVLGRRKFLRSSG